MNTLDFTSANILIIGDVMLDRYYFGEVTRISPEAPVPVVKVENVVSTLGGAANVANNISNLNANVHLLGIAKDDEAGLLLKKQLDELKCKHKLIDIGNPTITKLRVIGGKQQIVRLDFEKIDNISGNHFDDFKKYFIVELAKADIVIISDYGKGVCSVEVCNFVIDIANKAGKRSVVDPKGTDWLKYCNATVVTPNVKELSEATGLKVKNDDESILKYGQEIRKKYNIEYLVVTRSEKGITIIAEDVVQHIPTKAMEVFDVSGAGDTVVSTLAACLAVGYDMQFAVEVANMAAGVVVGKAGTAPITHSELLYAFQGSHGTKSLELDDLLKIINIEKLKGKRIVFTNGCFDILHIGHVTYLKKAKSLGDILILGLNSDASIKRLKGDARPINNTLDRAIVLSALECIDYVTIFNEDTPYDLIKAIKPDILVKGGDYKLEDVIGREFAGRVDLIDFVEGYSTTKTINMLKGE